MSTPTKREKLAYVHETIIQYSKSGIGNFGHWRFWTVDGIITQNMFQSPMFSSESEDAGTLGIAAD